MKNLFNAPGRWNAKCAGALEHSHTREAIHAHLEGGPRSNYLRANLLADGLAMAASNYIGTKAKRDFYDRVLGIEKST